MLLSSIPLHGCTTDFSHIKGHVGCFQFLKIVNKAIITFTYKFYVNVCFNFSWANIQEWKYWGMVSELFNFVRNHKTVFQSRCTNSFLLAMLQLLCISVSIWNYQFWGSFSPLFVLLVAILMDVLWYHITVLVSTFLTINNMDHALICLCTMSVS